MLLSVIPDHPLHRYRPGIYSGILYNHVDCALTRLIDSCILDVIARIDQSLAYFRACVCAGGRAVHSQVQGSRRPEQLRRLRRGAAANLVDREVCQRVRRLLAAAAVVARSSRRVIDRHVIVDDACSLVRSLVA